MILMCNGLLIISSLYFTIVDILYIISMCMMQAGENFLVWVVHSDSSQMGRCSLHPRTECDGSRSHSCTECYGSMSGPLYVNTTAGQSPVFTAATECYLSVT
jgi:hypothetical protein